MRRVDLALGAEVLTQCAGMERSSVLLD